MQVYQKSFFTNLATFTIKATVWRKLKGNDHKINTLVTVDLNSNDFTNDFIYATTVDDLFKFCKDILEEEYVDYHSFKLRDMEQEVLLLAHQAIQEKEEMEESRDD